MAYSHNLREIATRLSPFRVTDPAPNKKETKVSTSSRPPSARLVRSQTTKVTNKVKREEVVSNQARTRSAPSSKKATTNSEPTSHPRKKAERRKQRPSSTLNTGGALLRRSATVSASKLSKSYPSSGAPRSGNCEKNLAKTASPQKNALSPDQNCTEPIPPKDRRVESSTSASSNDAPTSTSPVNPKALSAKQSIYKALEERVKRSKALKDDKKSSEAPKSSAPTSKPTGTTRAAHQVVKLSAVALSPAIRDAGLSMATRFARAHRRVFDNMDSIVPRYARKQPQLIKADSASSVSGKKPPSSHPPRSTAASSKRMKA